MLIYQLELENFKSYNGRHTLGPFDPHFTCVIGPNGNGKSNIIDAVLFVFGFKSSKLRQDSLAALIHRSAFAHPEQASVTVTFREGETLTSVSRSVNRNGHSGYRLNGDRIGWAELREKLVSKRIDLNKNLFIILQGEVERLCQLSPDKMVEYLEYVSGSDEFKEAIEEAERKYIEGSIGKEELRAGVSVRRKVYENLRQRAGQQATWMLLRMKGLLLQHLTMKKIFLDSHTAYLELKQAEEQHSIACLQIEKDIREKEEQLKNKKAELKTVTTEYRKGEQYIQQIQQKRERVALRVKEAAREITFALRDKDSKQQERNRLAGEIQQLAQIEKQHQALEKRKGEICLQLRGVNECGKLKVCMELEQQLKRAIQEETTLAEKCAEDRLTLLADREKLAIYELKYKENKETILKCRAEIHKASDELVAITADLTENEELLLQMERQLNDKPNQKAMTPQERIISEIRSANKLKLICPDITLTTLRELLIIESAYADVVETILPHLDFFIVETLQQAQQVLDYLNKRKLGRTTLLIRESIRQATKDLQPATSCPRDTKLLYQVCKCTNQETRNILIWSLGNTLVTTRLDTAMKVAYYDEKRYRVITTNGEFIDTSGTITKLPLKNAHQRQDLQLLQKKQSTVKRIIASLRDRKREIEEKIENAQTVLAGVENQERSLDGLDEVFLKEMEEQLKENTVKLARAKKEVANHSENICKLQDKLKKAGFNMENYDKTLELLRQQAQGEQKIKKIANSHNLVASLNAKISEVDNSMTKLNSALQEKVKQKNQIETEKLRLEEHIDAKRKDLNVVKYGIDFIEAEIKELEGGRRMLEQQLGDSNRKGGLPQPREELKRVRGKIRTAQMEKLELMSKLQESIRDIKDFAQIICKTLAKTPQLIPTEAVQPEQKSDSQSIDKELNIKSLLDETVLVLGKVQSKFFDLLTQKESRFLLQGKQNGNLYFQVTDIRPTDPHADLLFDSIHTKDVKFAHSYEMEKLRHFEKEIGRTEAEVDFQLFEEYLQRKKEYQSQSEKLLEASRQVQTLKSQLLELRGKRLEVFLHCFNEINVELNKIYQQLTGGKAEISLLDSLNPLEGVEFSVRPVNKSWKRVNLLSGGEKTFTSLALIFACEQIKQFPFYFMDEIDAALDYRNTSLLASYITTKVHTQHIVISLRKNMYQECNRLVGVYKVKDQSRTVEMPMAALRAKEDHRGQGETEGNAG